MPRYFNAWKLVSTFVLVISKNTYFILLNKIVILFLYLFLYCLIAFIYLFYLFFIWGKIWPGSVLDNSWHGKKKLALFYKMIKVSSFIIKYRPTLIYSQPWCLGNHRPALINPVLPCCRASWDDIIREDRCSALQSGGRQIPSVFPSVSVLQQTPSLHAASKNTLLSSSPWPLFLLLYLALSIFPLSFSLSHGCLCSYCWTRRLARTEVSYVYYKEFNFSVGLEMTAHECERERKREREKHEEVQPPTQDVADLCVSECEWEDDSYNRTHTKSDILSIKKNMHLHGTVTACTG